MVPYSVWTPSEPRGAEGDMCTFFNCAHRVESRNSHTPRGLIAQDFQLIKTGCLLCFLSSSQSKVCSLGDSHAVTITPRARCRCGSAVAATKHFCISNAPPAAVLRSESLKHIVWQRFIQFPSWTSRLSPHPPPPRSFHTRRRRLVNMREKNIADALARPCSRHFRTIQKTSTCSTS